MSREGVRGKKGSLVTLARPNHGGMVLLLQARQYAAQFGGDPWEFAIELEELRREGMTVNDLRWLLLSNYVEHALEMTPEGDQPEHTRQFIQSGRSLSPRSCFLLTDRGMSFAAEALNGAPYTTRILKQLNIPAANGAPISVVRPVWDAVRHELTLKGRIVKRFKQHSPNQEAVLTAFEEEKWPPAIFDPLSPLPNVDRMQRMRDTIKNLNRHHIEPLLHFSGDGTGESILWKAKQVSS
jgi:hypothetical protein